MLRHEPLKYFDWDDATNAKLRAERGIGFEDIVFRIERGDLLDILEQPTPDRYAGQRNCCRPARGLRPAAVTTSRARSPKRLPSARPPACWRDGDKIVSVVTMRADAAPILA